MSLGVHFALSPEDLAEIRRLEDPDELVEFLCEDLEERYMETDEWSFQSDKAWDPIHRCLADGRLLFQTGPFPLAYAVLGGVPLDTGEDYVACLVEPEQVAEVSVALEGITKAWMRSRYDALKATDYAGPMCDEDFEYAWENLEGLREFFGRAAKASRAVLFTAS